jgi:hypothetical protein
MKSNAKLKELIQKEIISHHALGEQAGGSGHLGYVSLTKLEIEDPAEIEFKLLVRIKKLRYD